VSTAGDKQSGLCVSVGCELVVVWVSAVLPLTAHVSDPVEACRGGCAALYKHSVVWGWWLCCAVLTRRTRWLDLLSWHCWLHCKACVCV
jgi:hypothetical protein